MEFRLYYKTSYQEIKSIIYECETVWFAEKAGKSMFGDRYIGSELISNDKEDKNVGEDIHSIYSPYGDDFDD